MTALVGFWACAQAWLRHAISALAADARAHAARARFADAALLVEAPHPASLSLRAAFDASPWVGITARSAHGRVRRLNGSPWVAVIRPAALAPTWNPAPARSLWRLRFGPASRWRSRFHMPEAPTTWLRARGMQDLHFYVRSRFATSPAQIILPLPGCSPTTARPVAWVRLRRFRLCVSAKVKALRFNLARPSVCRYRGSSCVRGVSCGAGHP